jgi:UDP:flavonoid glycosyltransferase YjiC (YdhE family)
MNRNHAAGNHSAIEPGTRILFANVPADGHFNPLTGLAVYLKELGCDVRWYTAVKYAGKIGRLDIPFYPLQQAMDISASDDMDEIFPQRNQIKSQVGRLKFDLINVFILRGPEYYADILHIYQEFPFELMIADVTFGGIPFVKEKMNIPVMAINVIPLPETSKDLPPAGLGLTPSKSIFGKTRQALLRFIANKVLFAAPNKVMKNVLAEYGIQTNGANIFDVIIRKSTVVMQSGTPGFEYQRTDMSPHIHFAGPMLPYASKKSPSKWFDEKLRKFDKVILVTQGTVEKDVEKIIAPTLEAYRNTDRLVIVTTGGSQTAELRQRYPDENFIIEDFIAFNDVMPYADVYVTNGGYGGVLLSVQNKLPMVAAGMHEGKNEINARIGYFRLGVNLKTEKPSPAQIRKGVEEILTSHVYAANITRLSEEFKRYNANEICARHVARLVPRATAEKTKEKHEASFIY